VGSADTAGRIVTYDTPPQVQGAARAARFQAVRRQTRAQYCHPRAEIEQPEATAVHTTQTMLLRALGATAAPVAAAARVPQFTRYEDRP
jgi:hypothetical protein